MEKTFRKYEDKLQKSGLARRGAALLGSLDARLRWNRSQPECALLEKVIEQLNVSAVIFARPSEPYASIIDFLAETSDGKILPQDCETRTFLHDLPVSFEFTADALASTLKHRKSAILPGRGVVTHGAVGLEQALVTFSSVCFACFVKFFSDYLSAARRAEVSRRRQAVFERAVDALDPLKPMPGTLMKGPFHTEAEVHAAMTEAGNLIVAHRLVDSFFGNISYGMEQTLYISQTGSSLDELKGCIDACPINGSSCVAITASSELPTHLEIVRTTGYRAILHGHPKFSVILSMDCDIADCDHRGMCHLRCPRDRFACGTPMVSGEVGSGRHGLCHTVPAAISAAPGVIVFGHGVFAAGKTDFNRPFETLLSIEENCRREFFERLKPYA